MRAYRLCDEAEIHSEAGVVRFVSPYSLIARDRLWRRLSRLEGLRAQVIRFERMPSPPVLRPPKIRQVPFDLRWRRQAHEPKMRWLKPDNIRTAARHHRDEVIAEHGLVCYWCHRTLKIYPPGTPQHQPDQFTIDHKTPISGCTDFHPNAPWNLVPSCPPCNHGRQSPPKPKNVHRNEARRMAIADLLPPEQLAEVRRRFKPEWIGPEDGDPLACPPAPPLRL